MLIRCTTCHKEDDLVELKPVYVYVHKGDCERWLKNRAEFGPSWMMKLLDDTRMYRMTALLFVAAAVYALFK